MTSAFVATLLDSGGQKGVYKYDGSAWNKTTPAGIFSLFNVMRNPSGHFLIYGDGIPGYLISTDDGSTWAGSSGAAKNAGGFGWPIGFDDSDAIYDVVNSSQSIEKSTDGGSSFSPDSPFVQVSDLPFATNSESVWVSQGLTYWNERAHESGLIVASLSRSDGSSYLDSSVSQQMLVRGLYDVGEWVIAYANLGARLWLWAAPSPGFSPDFTDLTGSLPALGVEGVFSIVPFDRQTWFLAEGQASLTHCKIWRTTDGGSTWAVVSTDSRAVPLPAGNGGANFIDRNPRDHNEYVMAAQGGVFSSMDGGDTWTFVASPNGSEAFAAVQFSNVPGIALLGTKNGLIYRRFGAEDWRLVFDIGFSFGTIFGLAPQRVDNSKGIASAWDTGSIPNELTTNDDGLTWDEQVRGSSVGFIFPERSSLDDADNLYTVWGSGFFLTGQIWKSTDKGATWLNIGTGGSPNGPQSPVVANGYLWFLDYQHGTDDLYRCNLDGTGGISFGGVLTGPGHQRSLTTEPGTNRLYAYGSGSGTSDFVAIDVSNPSTPVVTTGEIDSSRGVFEIHPVTPMVAIALCYGGGHEYIYRTDDAGATWTLVQGGLPYSATWSGTDTAIAIDPGNSSRIFVAPPTGGAPPTVWLSNDQGETWNTETVTGASIGSVVAWSSVTVLGGGGTVVTPPPPTSGKARTWIARAG